MARRIGALQRHLDKKAPRGSSLRSLQCGPHLVEFADCPSLDPQTFEAVLSPEALSFLAALVHRFDDGTNELYRRRRSVQNEIEGGNYKFAFLPDTRHVREGDWKVAPLPPRMQDRRVDVGDVSPDDALALVLALNSGAQGVQCDFDDGFCPTYRNVLQAVHNITQAAHGTLTATQPDGRTVRVVSDPGVMMLRPRAWNMVESHVFVNGKAVPGPLFDFGLLIFHCGAALQASGRGPFFYCSKVEGYLEARLWNAIFSYAEETLRLPSGCIKACVLIENVTASFQMDEILYELRAHSAGLNCGIWDYSASFVARFASRSDMVFPDRTKYVNMKCPFMRAYMRLLVETCHRRGALATTGMAALVADPRWPPTLLQDKVSAVREAKAYEAQAGADGALIYDVSLVPTVRHVFDTEFAARARRGPPPAVSITEIAADLLSVPPGGITMDGVRFNAAIGLRFIESWCRGRGSFVFSNGAEDSATAEISRSQIWQWVHHGRRTEDGIAITMEVVQRFIDQAREELERELIAAGDDSEAVRARVATAARLLEAVTRTRIFPQFLTTYLYDQMLFQGAVEWQN